MESDRLQAFLPGTPISEDAPFQSNDAAVLIAAGDAGDVLVSDNREKLIVLQEVCAFRQSSYTGLACVPDLLEVVLFTLLISSLHGAQCFTICFF